MTTPDVKVTYNLISRTIINTLANESVNHDVVSAFCLQMYWGIIMAYPDPGTGKKEVTDRLLQSLITNNPQAMRPDIEQEIQQRIQLKKDLIDQIFKTVRAASAAAKPVWYNDWEHHCTAFFQPEASHERLLQLFAIFNESMGIRSKDMFTSIYIINKTLQHDTHQMQTGS